MTAPVAPRAAATVMLLRDDEGWEAVHVEWWRRAGSLADWHSGRIELIEPTVAGLRLLPGGQHR